MTARHTTDEEVITIVRNTNLSRFFFRPGLQWERTQDITYPATKPKENLYLNDWNCGLGASYFQFILKKKKEKRSLKANGVPVFAACCLPNEIFERPSWVISQQYFIWLVSGETTIPAPFKVANERYSCHGIN